MKIVVIGLFLLFNSVSFAQSIEGLEPVPGSTFEFEAWFQAAKSFDAKIQMDVYNTEASVVKILNDLRAASHSVGLLASEGHYAHMWDPNLPSPDEQNRTLLLEAFDHLKAMAISHWVGNEASYEEFWSAMKEVKAKRLLAKNIANRNIVSEAIRGGFVQNLPDLLLLLDLSSTTELNIGRGSLVFENEIKNFQDLLALSRYVDLQTRGLLLEKALKEKLVTDLMDLRTLVGVYAYPEYNGYYGIADTVFEMVEGKEPAEWLSWIGFRYLPEIQRLAANVNVSSNKILEDLFGLTWGKRVWLDLTMSPPPKSFLRTSEALEVSKSIPVLRLSRCANIFAF